MRQKLLEMFQVTVLFHTDEFIFVWSLKNGNGCQTTPRGPKLGYFDGRVPKLSSRVTLAMSGQRGTGDFMKKVPQLPVCTRDR